MSPFDNLARYFKYLDELRDSGRINMNAAEPQLALVFGLDRGEARKVLIQWKDTFDGKSRPADRAARAVA